jgi:putative methionine-R-sulfoxide reductase with GAF domain
MEPTGPKLAGNSRQFKPATERRHTLRHRTHSPAYVMLNPAQGNGPDLSEILDISEEGMSIQTSSALQVEHHLSFCLDLSETQARIQTTGQVVWSDASGRAGIRFAKLSGSARGQLQEWLFANVLTAVDHAIAGSPDRDGWKSVSKELLLSHTMPKNQLEVSGSGTPAADKLSTERVRTTEVEPNRFDREAELQAIAERALKLTRATGAAIALTEGNDNEMACVASAGSDAPPVGARLQVGSGFSGECVRTGRSLRCDDSETDDRVDRDGCRALGIRSMIAVPIRPVNKVTGLLEVFSPQPFAFNADDISALQQLTGSIRAKVAPPVEAQIQVPQIPKAPAPRPLKAPTENRPSGEIAAVSATRPTPAEKSTPARTSDHRQLHKILLVAAVGTFIFAVLWLIAPWVSSTIGSSGRAPTRAQAQTPLPKSSGLSGTDLAALRKLAEKGDPAAQFQLGARYATGEEVAQDYTEAVRWFTMAAEQGHILAQATLGAYYWAGRGVPQDLTKAYYWSVLAQAGGDQASKYRVAVLTSRMSRGQVVAAQQQADDWLRTFAGRASSSP